MSAQQATMASESGDIQALCSQKMKDKHLAQAVACHLLTVAALAKEQYKDAFEKQMAAYSCILDYFKDSDSNWVAMVFVRFSDDTVLLF